MKSKIPTILGLFILLTATGSTLFAIKNFQGISTNAEISVAPIDVRITNVKDTSFTVNWITDKPSIGFVSYSSNSNIDTERTPNEITHSITIQNLNPSTLYSFKINSNGQFFQNNNSPWQIQTHTTNFSSDVTVVSGQILNANNLPAKNALVYIETGSSTYSSQVSISGNWVITLPSLSENTILNILVENSSSETASAKINIKNANPTPVIKLGNSYDFSGQSEESSQINPTEVIQLP
ncbi:hypothetical protein BH10PAT1_BH10PAT1_1950 [soil metagenome]